MPRCARRAPHRGPSAPAGQSRHTGPGLVGQAAAHRRLGGPGRRGVALAPENRRSSQRRRQALGGWRAARYLAGHGSRFRCARAGHGAAKPAAAAERAEPEARAADPGAGHRRRGDAEPGVHAAFRWCSAACCSSRRAAGRLRAGPLSSRAGCRAGCAPVVAVVLAAPLATVAMYLCRPAATCGFSGAPKAWCGASLRSPARPWCSASCWRSARWCASATRGAPQATAVRARTRRLEKQALDARLRLLQAQIEPHFLFNTLANVQALVESGSPRAAAC